MKYIIVNNCSDCIYREFIGVQLLSKKERKSVAVLKCKHKKGIKTEFLSTVTIPTWYPLDNL